MEWRDESKEMPSEIFQNELKESSRGIDSKWQVRKPHSCSLNLFSWSVYFLLSPTIPLEGVNTKFQAPMTFASTATMDIKGQLAVPTEWTQAYDRQNSFFSFSLMASCALILSIVLMTLMPIQAWLFPREGRKATCTLKLSKNRTGNRGSTPGVVIHVTWTVKYHPKSSRCRMVPMMCFYLFGTLEARHFQ